MLFLWVFGNAVNYKMGHGGYIAFYLLSALISGWGLYLTNCVPVLGASGAIFGVVGAYLVLFPRNDMTVIWIWNVFASETTELSGYWMIVFWMAYNLYGLLGGSHEAVAWVSHLTGFVFGFAVAWGLVQYKWIQPTRYEETLLDVFRKLRKETEPEV